MPLDKGHILRIVEYKDLPQEDRDFLALSCSINPPPRVDPFDLAAILFNALHETGIENMRYHVWELAELLGYQEKPEP